MQPDCAPRVNVSGSGYDRRMAHVTTAERRGELGQQLRVDSVRMSAAAGSGHPTSAMSAADLLAVLVDGYLRYDFADAEEPRERPARLLEGPRVHAAVRDLPRRGCRLRRGVPRLPHVREHARGPPDPAHPVGRRRDRLARPGPADRRRHGARRRNSSTGCPTASGCSAVTARWPRAPCGRPSSTPRTSSSTT